MSEINYSELTKEQLDLVNTYCKNDMKKLKEICFFVWGQKHIPNFLHDDLYDDAMKVLLESVVSFNPCKKVKFRTYLTKNIRLSYSDWHRDNYLRAKRNNLLLDKKGRIVKDENGMPIIIPNISFDAPADDGVDLCEKLPSDFDVEDEISDYREDYSPEMREYLYNKLSKPQRKILKLMSEGYLKEEIIEMLCIDSAMYQDSIAAIKSNKNTRKIKRLIRGGQKC